MVKNNKNIIICTENLEIYNISIDVRIDKKLSDEDLSDMFFAPYDNLNTICFLKSEKEFSFLKTDIKVYFVSEAKFPWLKNIPLSDLFNAKVSGQYCIIVEKNYVEGGLACPYDVFIDDVSNLISYLKKRLETKNKENSKVSEKYGLFSIKYIFSEDEVFNIKYGNNKENLDKFWEDKCIEKFTDVTTFINCKEIINDKPEGDFAIMYNSGMTVLFNKVYKTAEIYPNALTHTQYENINSDDKDIQKKSLKEIFN